MSDNSSGMAGQSAMSARGDGRAECETCGKWVWPVIHSCKGIPVTEAARDRWRIARPASMSAEKKREAGQ